jgi:CubicO group peptidase (beta-lactamase class C family)
VTRALDLVVDQPSAAGWARSQSEDIAGPVEQSFEWASVTKVLTSLAVWVAVEEGILSWDRPAGPPGSTLAHLLSHASGLSTDSEDVICPPGSRRIYSNRGIEIAAEVLESVAGFRFADYVREAVLEPLEMNATELVGSAAWGARGPLVDLLALGKELASPRLVSPATVTEVTTVAFPGLAGVLPGFGRFDPNDWGLGVELRGSKHPHWTGTANSERTFGHFGRSGSFVWIDPAKGVVLGYLGARQFGPWALEEWPRLADAVLEETGSLSG